MVTHAREANISREEETVMAVQMNHSLPTADKIYDVGKKYQITRTCRRILKSVFSDMPDENTCNSDLEEEEEEMPEPILEPIQTEIFKYQKTKKENCRWDDRDKEILRKSVGEWMKTHKEKNSSVSRKDLVKKIEASPFGVMLLKKFSHEQIYTRVRFIVRGTYKF